MTLKLKDAINAIIKVSVNDKEAKQMNRFMSCTFPHMGLKVWYRKRKYRVIANTQVNNKYQLPATTVYQRKEHIETFLTSCEDYSNFDLSCFFDMIPCDCVTSFLNTVLYLGREYAPLTSPMGSTNAPLAATNIVRDILIHVNDALITQKFVKPREDVHEMKVAQPSRTMTTRES